VTTSGVRPLAAVEQVSALRPRYRAADYAAALLARLDLPDEAAVIASAEAGDEPLLHLLLAVDAEPSAAS
jgi:hypothetical protein